MKIIKSLKESAIEFPKSFKLILISAILWAVLKLVSIGSKKINHIFSTNIQFTVYIILFFIVYLAIFSLFFPMLINFKEKNVLKNIKFFFSSFLILLMISLTSLAISAVSHYSALYIGKFIGLNILAAKILFFMVYITLLLSTLIFLTFSIFFLVTENKGVKSAIKNSRLFVKSNYSETIAILVSAFVLFFLINLLPEIFGELIEYLIVIPFSVIFIKRLIKKEK